MQGVPRRGVRRPRRRVLRGAVPGRRVQGAGARLIGSKGDGKLADDAYAVDGELAYAHVQNNSSQARPRTCHVCKCACLFGRVSCLSVETKDEIYGTGGDAVLQLQKIQ